MDRLWPHASIVSAPARQGSWARRRVIPGVILVVCLASGSASAQNDPREAEARRECLAGRYQRGIDLLAALFTETRDPNHLFNQARCYQQNNRPDEAISRFREYLRKAPNLPAAESAEVQGHIRDCEKLKAEQQAAAHPASATDVELRERLARDEERRARNLRIAGISIAAAGAVALGFGGYMGYRTKDLESDFQEKQKLQMGAFFDRKAYNSGQRAELFQWIGYAVGAVAIGTGGIFYYLGYRERESGQVALVTAVGPHGAEAHLRWHF
jgi:tetratricopeptide (TPR) repeat protein